MSSSMLATLATLASLPDEILILIARQLDSFSIFALQLTSKRFADVVNEPSLWRDFCRTDFRFWNDKQKFRAWLFNPPTQPESDLTLPSWRSLYVSRRTNFRSVLDAVQELVEDPIGRSDRIQGIVDGGYHVKDALVYTLKVDPTSPTYLAQRYWSWVTLGCLHRTRALEQWKQIIEQDDIDSPTERALAALDMFILDSARPGDIDDVFDQLNSYAQSVQQAHPDIDEQSPRRKAIIIASHLRDMHWLGIDQGRAYYNLDHMFLGVALHSTHRNSLPLVSAVIYSYVCRKFGLRAQPCSFPLHVHSVVNPPIGFDLDGNRLSTDNLLEISLEQVNLYMDPYNTSDPIPLSALRQQLRFMDSAFPANQLDQALEPADYRSLLIRTVHNLINSMTTRRTLHTHPIDVDSAIYGARFALAMFPSHPAAQRTNLKDLTQTFLHSFDQDTYIFRNYIMPLTASTPDHPAYQSLAAQLLAADLEKPPVKIRPGPPSFLRSFSTSNNQVKYKVGQVFRHRRRGYLAVIYGWDSTCEMSTQWITDNGVDELPKGRNQPFYNSFVAHDKSTRYVAQENILLCGTIWTLTRARDAARASAHRAADEAEQNNTSSPYESSTHDPQHHDTPTIDLNYEEENTFMNPSPEIDLPNDESAEPAMRWQVISDEEIKSFGIMVGKWFRRFDYDRAVFVSNVRDEYPDD